MKYIPTFLYKPQNGSNKFCVCTPDGGFLYIGIKSVSFIKKQDGEPLIKVFNTKQPIIAIDVDTQWNAEGKLFASLTSENSILIWDFVKGIAVSGHKAHCPQISKVNKVENSQNTVHMSFMKNRNLLSMNNSEIVVYCVTSNTTCVRPNFVANNRQDMTALKCSPYNENYFAVGTNRGLVLLCDIQKATVIHTLRGHQSAVVSLSWNLIEISTGNDSPSKDNNLATTLNRVAVDNDEIFNIYDYDYLENEFGAPLKTGSSTKQNNDEESKENEIPLNPNFNFQEACESLKQEINALNKNQTEDEPRECDAVTLADCENTKNCTYSSSVASVASESTEGSLELVDHNSSSDESCHVDGNEMKLLQSNEDCKMATKLEKNKVGKNEIKEDDTSYIVLASASCCGYVYIWNTMTGSCCSHIKSNNKNISKKSSEISAVWRNSTELWVNNQSGDIIQWTITPDVSVSPNSSSFRNEKRIIRCSQDKVCAFDIARNSDFLWFVTSGPEIVLENIRTREIILQYATATTSISVIRESPENNSKIAFAFADRRITILDSSQLSQTKIVMQYCQCRLHSFAKMLAWSEDGCHLAYGTIEGQAGYISLDNQKHSTFNTICGKPIYSMIWRGDIIFFTCSDKLFAYRIGNRDPLSIQGIISAVSSATIHNNFLLLGTVRGYIDIYEEKKSFSSVTKTSLAFQLLRSVEVAKHYITEISWNPLTNNQFAVVANEGCIYLLTFDATEGTASLTKKIEFGNPKACLSTVKWSNRNPHKFVTCGFDGALRLFDLNRPAGDEVCFVKQFHCPLNSALLLPCDEQFALCTGKSITVEIVDMSESNTTVQSSKNLHTLDYIKWAAKMNVNYPTAGNKKKEKILAKRQATNQEKLADELIEKVIDMTIDDKEMPATKGNSTSSFLKNSPTLMQNVTREQNKNPLEKLKEVLTLNICKQREVVFTSRLFGNKKDAKNLLIVELEKLKTSTSVSELGTTFMSQVNGNLKDVILKAIQNRKLNEWHISLAPSISYSFWQKCCQAFAEQLLEEGYALQAATFLLGMHNQLGAIDMLMSANYFKEALLIARVYLSEKDPLINIIIDNWIDQLEKNGNLPAAALICALSQQFNRGYEILSKQRAIGPDVEHLIKLLKDKSK